jgi:hypothetical protein
MKSILQDEKACILTGRTDSLHAHHVYGGPNRRVSQENGFWVWLTYDMHNGNDPAAVHNNPNNGNDLLLKQWCQRAYEESGHSREEFISLIGRSYL